MAKIAALLLLLILCVTGQLFFDSSHFVFSGGSRIRKNPARSSLWERHPLEWFGYRHNAGLRRRRSSGNIYYGGGEREV
jgi:hypothetical protein